MYFLARLCRICVTKEEHMKSLYSPDTDSISYYSKLVICVPELQSEQFTADSLLCGKCCLKLSNLYKFRNYCMRNKYLFEGYVSQLKQGINNTTNKQGDLFVNLEGIHVDVNEILFNKQNMTSNKDAKIGNTVAENSFSFDVTLAEELRMENCVPVAVSSAALYEGDGTRNIEVLSGPSLEVAPSIWAYDISYCSDRNTDGEITVEKGDDSNSQESNVFTTDDQVKLANECSEEIKMSMMWDYLKAEVSRDSHQLILQDIQNIVVRTCKSEEIELEDNNSTNEGENWERKEAELAIFEENVTPENIVEEHVPVLESSVPALACPETMNGNCSEETRMDENAVTCDICGNSYPNSVKLWRHKIGVHYPQNPIACDFCGKQFKGSYRYRKHMKTHLSDGSTQWICKCDVCGQRFTDLDSCVAHQQTHPAPALVKCVLCEEKFSEPTHVENHLKSHSGSMSYECENCGDVFYKMYDYKAHIRTHTGQKLYICNICNKNYSTSTSLKRHKHNVHERSVTAPLPL